uniref:Uncharacterized protein n=1 Tax=Arundo donax TaxID=35708 RepID=A0A0A8YEF6_ARUDO
MCFVYAESNILFC